EAGTMFLQPALSRDVAGKDAIGILIENHLAMSANLDFTLKADRMAYQGAILNEGAAGIAVGTCEGGLASAGLRDGPGADHVTHVYRGGILAEFADALVDDIAWQAVSIAHKHTGNNPGSAAIAIAFARQDERAEIVLYQHAPAGQVAVDVRGIGGACRCAV